MKIYLIWDHDEDGPDELWATCDKDKIMTIINQSGYVGFIADMENKVAGFVENGGVGVLPLTNGWGGLHLQIAEEFTELMKEEVEKDELRPCCYWCGEPNPTDKNLTRLDNDDFICDNCVKDGLRVI